MNKELTTSLFRMSAILYAHNNSDSISQRQIIKKIIEDALMQMHKDRITDAELSQFIQDEYKLTISYDEIGLIVKDKKFADNFDIISENESLTITLNAKRRLQLSRQAENKNLADYIDDFLLEEVDKNSNENKKDLLYRFLYGVFTTNLEGYKQLLQEAFHVDVPDNSFSDIEKEIINRFLNWDNKEKNRAIYNLASYALEYCMLTNDKNTTLDIQNLRNKALYLDTNSLFRAIGINGDVRKQRTLRFLSKFHSVQETIKITSETDLEFKDALKYYLDKLEKAERTAPYVNSTCYVEYVDIDGIFRAYHRWKIGRSNASVEVFKSSLFAAYKQLLEDYSISIDTRRPYNLDEKQSILKEYSSQIHSASDDTKQINAAECDAKNILWIESLRENQTIDIFKTKSFFISSDHHLRRWDYYRNSNNVPVVMLPSQWLSLVLRYMERTDDDYACFVCFLNIKTGKPLLNEEQLQYVISGISEMTQDVYKEKYLVQSFIQNEFEDGIKDVSNEDLLVFAKQYATSKLEQENKNLLLNNQNKDEQINKLKSQIADSKKQIESLSNSVIYKNQVLEEKDFTIMQLTDSQKHKELLKWKRYRLFFYCTIIIVMLTLIVLCFVAHNWKYNIMAIIINWIDSFKSETLKNIGYAIILLPISAIIGSIKRLITISKKHTL